MRSVLQAECAGGGRQRGGSVGTQRHSQGACRPVKLVLQLGTLGLTEGAGVTS